MIDSDIIEYNIVGDSDRQNSIIALFSIHLQGKKWR